MDNQTSFPDDLRRYLGLLWRWGWVLTLASLLSGVTAYLLSRRITPVYQASSLVLINEAPSSKALDYTSILTSERLTRTYAQVMTTRPVVEGVIQRLDLSLTVKELQDAIDVKPVRETQLIRVKVEDTDPNRAALLANALVAEFAEQNLAEQASRFAATKGNLEAQLTRMDQQIQETNAALNNLTEDAEDQADRDRLEAALAQYRQAYASLLQSYEQVRMTEAETIATTVQKEPAVPPLEAVRPLVLLNTALAALIGLFLAAAIIFISDSLDDTVRDPENVAHQLGLPVLGLIARHPVNGKPIALGQPRSPVAEAFRSLRTNLQFTCIDRPLHTLLVTSPSPKDGKSTVAVNLGVVMAQGGRLTVVVDGDLRRPNVHRLLGLPNVEGASSLFLGENDTGDRKINLAQFVRPTEVSNLLALTSGNIPPNPADLLGSERMRKILEELGEVAEMIVIDSPPVLAVTDSVVLARYVDGVILVVKPGTTKLVAAKEAVEQLQRVGANLLGVVLNDVEIRRTRYADFRYKGYYNLDGNLEEFKAKKAKGSDRSWAAHSHR